MRFKTLLWMAAALVISGFTPVSADHHEPPPPPSKEDMFNQMDANGDGMVTWDEFQAWYDAHHMGGPMDGGEHTEGGPMDGGEHMDHGEHMEGEMPVPPECSEEMRQSEQQPQQTNVPASNGMQGNLLFRTVCADMPGYDQAAISLPPGRQALDFDAEAMTAGNIVFGIKDDMGNNVFHSSAGKAAFHALVLENAASSTATAVFSIYLDVAASDPGSRITVRFIDTPK